MITDKDLEYLNDVKDEPRLIVDNGQETKINNNMKLTKEDGINYLYITEKLFIHFINDWSQLFEGRLNWYSFHFINIYFANDSMTVGYEFDFIILGIGIHLRYNTYESLRYLSEEAKRKMSEVKKGLKNGMWIKDRSIVLEGKKARKSTENNNWKKKCKENDGNTCQKYGIKGSNLAVHHINNFADFPPELRFVIDNGITLSYKAYKEFHKIYGRKNNTREQLEEFLTKEIEDKHNIK